MTKDERIKELKTISLRLFDMVHESDLIELKVEANDLYKRIVNNGVLDDVINTPTPCSCCGKLSCSGGCL